MRRLSLVVHVGELERPLLALAQAGEDGELHRGAQRCRHDVEQLPLLDQVEIGPLVARATARARELHVGRCVQLGDTAREGVFEDGAQDGERVAGGTPRDVLAAAPPTAARARRDQPVDPALHVGADDGAHGEVGELGAGDVGAPARALAVDGAQALQLAALERLLAPLAQRDALDLVAVEELGVHAVEDCLRFLARVVHPQRSPAAVDPGLHVVAAVRPKGDRSAASSSHGSPRGYASSAQQSTRTLARHVVDRHLRELSCHRARPRLPLGLLVALELVSELAEQGGNPSDVHGCHRCGSVEYDSISG